MNIMVNINNLPKDCIYLILGHVELHYFVDDMTCDASYLNNLSKCSICYESDKKCMHLHISEFMGINSLRLVCKLWKGVIDERFHFTSLRF